MMETGTKGGEFIEDSAEKKQKMFPVEQTGNILNYSGVFAIIT
ncbi:hypothetical protein [Paenibacillus sp. JNUCC31]|nr:hypothetical protein [Paenibacillus sp. JNUCC-31]